jgi:tetratricopeptide (TPR) repeat protein
MSDSLVQVSFTLSGEHNIRADSCTDGVHGRIRTRFYHIILGDIHFENQKYKDAAREYLSSAELRNTHVSDLHFSLELLFAKIAKALYYSGRNEQALEYAARASLLDPENNEVAQLICKFVMRQSALHERKTLNH